MTGKLARGVALATALLAGSVAAQESTNRVATETDWSVFVETDPAECWGVSQPKETVNTRDGKVVAVNRGDILLFVSYRPADDVEGEISFTGGYPFAGGSTVSMTVGDKTFELFTKDNWAWPATDADDAAIREAMKSGTDAVLTARSTRGTQTKDTFSLLGFTAAMEEAAARCAG